MHWNRRKAYKAQVFNRGQSAKIFKEVVEEDSAAYVIRNSEPYVAIIKYDSYVNLVRKAEKYDALEGEKNA